LNILNGAAVAAGDKTYIGYQVGSSGTIHFGAAGGSLSTKSLWVSPSQLTGTGTINTEGLVSDVNLVFDSSHGLVQTFLIPGDPEHDPDRNITVNLDMSDAANSSDFGAGYLGAGSLTIRNAIAVKSGNGYLGYAAAADGTASVTGSGSKWTCNSLNVGYFGTGTLNVLSAAAVVSSGGVIGFQAGSTGTVNVSGNNSKWTNSASLAVGRFGHGVLNIADKGTVTNTHAYLGDQAGSTGAASVSGIGSTWTNSGEFIVGHQGYGTLAISAGGSVSSTGDAYVGYWTGVAGQVSVSGAGSKWATGKYLHVGESGNGTVTITGGATVNTASYGFIGNNTGSTGKLTIDGVGSKWDVVGGVFVGYAGDGELNITDGGVIRDSFFLAQNAIGYEVDSKGVATVSGAGSTWATIGAMGVGYSGDGTLNISDGGVVTVGGTTMVAWNPGSTGKIDFGDGGGTLATKMLWASSSQLLGTGTIHARGLVSDVALVFDDDRGTIQTFAITGPMDQNVTVNLNMSNPADVGDLGAGYLTTGSITIRDGMNVNSITGQLGYHSGSSGSATITGANSKWTTSEEFYVGNSGNGTLTVGNGGTLESYYAVIGDEDGSSGTATITGGGSTWTNVRDITIGVYGSGVLNVFDGGVVNNRDGCVGGYSSATGRANVHGDGSKWNNSSYLYVGKYSDGELSVGDGGLVTAGYAYLGENAGTTGILTVDGYGSKLTNSSYFYVGYSGNGTVRITGGGTIQGYPSVLSYNTGSTSDVLVNGDGSNWTCSGSMAIGRRGLAILTITAGGTVTNGSGRIADQSSATGFVMVDGAGSKWTNNGALNFGSSGKGTLNIANGGAVLATTVSINSLSLLSIAVDGSSSLIVGGGSGAITNGGTVRIMAGAVPATDAVYTPISAGAWTESGVCQAVGGTWDALAREFTVSKVAASTADSPVVIDLSDRQRIRVDDIATGWTVGASFLAREAIGGAYSETMMMPNPNELAFTATVIDEMALANLEAILDSGELVLGAWDFDVVGAYAAGDPAYLSFEVGASFSRDNLRLWHYDGADWEAYDAMDLTYDGRYASFTVAGFSGYAVSGVPEPTVFALLLAAGLCVISRRPIRRGRV
ncbi:MAG TPA: hypothetical protein DD670_00410, partial [Planctomycetaceae bacterium]|nr:hypothetical protein [Planctomycetaceae bacterium]